MNFENPTENIVFPKIAQEIKSMVDIDQKIREQNQNEDTTDKTIDEKHTARMKEIIAEIGWPSISKVGSEGASDAWLLIQHADHDIAFQAHCLQLMKEIPSNDIDITNIAYLEDRVRVNQGKSQLYGTQFTQENGRHILKPIEDEKNVDARRAEIGMKPLSEQIQDMYDRYPLND